MYLYTYLCTCVCVWLSVLSVVTFPNRIVKFQLNDHMKCNFNVQIFRLFSSILPTLRDFYFAFAYRVLLNLICFTTWHLSPSLLLHFPLGGRVVICAFCGAGFIEAFNFRFIRDSAADEPEPEEESARLVRIFTVCRMQSLTPSGIHRVSQPCCRLPLCSLYYMIYIADSLPLPTQVGQVQPKVKLIFNT